MTTPGEDDEQPEPLGPLPAFLNTVNIVQVAMGYEFALALDDTGRVYAWGNENFYGVTSVPPEAQTGVKKITAGTNFAYVLKTDGTVVGWGDPAGNRFDYTGLTGITDIESAWNDTLFIDSNRKAHHRGERTYDLTDWAHGIDGIAVGRFNIAANQFGWAKVKGLPNNGALNIDPALEAGIEWIHAVGGTSFFARAANGTIVGWGSDSARLLTGILDFLEDYPDVTSTYQALDTEAGLIKLHDPNRRLGRFFPTSTYATGMIDAAGHINTIEEIRQNVLGRSSNKDSIYFYDDVVVHKISVMLHEVNNSPLANPLYNKISRFVFEKKFKIKAALDGNVSSKSEPLSILVSGYKVTRESGR